MSDSTLDESQWLASWKKASARMDALRKDDMTRMQIGDIIEALEEAFQSARRQIEPPKTSGLVEQQAWFMKGSR